MLKMAIIDDGVNFSKIGMDMRKAHNLEFDAKNATFQHRRVPFIIHEEDDYGNELIFRIRTGEKLYDCFVHMKAEAERSIRRFRY